MAKRRRYHSPDSCRLGFPRRAEKCRGIIDRHPAGDADAAEQAMREIIREAAQAMLDQHADDHPAPSEGPAGA